MQAWQQGEPCWHAARGMSAPSCGASAAAAATCSMQFYRINRTSVLACASLADAQYMWHMHSAANNPLRSQQLRHTVKRACGSLADTRYIWHSSCRLILPLSSLRSSLSRSGRPVEDRHYAAYL